MLKGWVKMSEVEEFLNGRPLETPGKIYELMPKVMSEVKPVAKAGKNEKQNYKFRKVEDVYASCQHALAKHGISVWAKIIDMQRDKFQSKSGNVGFHVVYHYRFRFRAPDGSFDDVYSIGEATDYSDKASNKAASFAQKYALLSAFNIPTEDISEADKESPELGHTIKNNNARSQVSNGSNAALSSNIVTDKQRKFLFAKSKEFGLSPEMMTALVKKEFGYESSKEIKKNEVDKVLELMQRQQDYMQGFKKDNEEELKNFAPGSDDTGQDLGPPPFDYDEEMAL